nr:hypothetical protein [uncultured Bacteroides sp.]
MIKRTLIFSLFVWIGLLSTYAQTEAQVVNYPQFEKGYVYLKNGEIIKGKYIYSVNLDKIRVVSGNVSRVIDASDIEMISKSRKVVKEEKMENGASIFVPSAKKFFNLTEIGLLIGNSDNKKDAPLVFRTSFDYNINKNFAAGLGLGIDFLNETYMPVTANVIYKFRNEKYSPYIMLQGGYEIPIDDSQLAYNDIVPSSVISYNTYYWSANKKLDPKGGFLFSPSMGLLVQLNSQFGLNMSVGYQYHRQHYTSSDNYKLDIDYNRLLVKLGITIY